MEVTRPTRESTALTLCFWIGPFMIFAGLLHLPVYLTDIRPWEGNASWRKPILFGVSTGITLLSLDWVINKVIVKRQFQQAFGALLAGAALLEVSLITFQTWRKIPAHFNMSSSSEMIISFTIEACLGIILILITYLTVLAGRKLSKHTPMDRSIRSGMLLLWLGCIFGLIHVAYGYTAVVQGMNPHLVPPEGVPKFAHGMPLHAIQILPLCSLVTGLANFTEKSRLVFVIIVEKVIIAMTLYACLQVVLGASRFEPALLSIAVVGIYSGYELLRMKTRFPPTISGETEQL